MGSMIQQFNNNLPLKVLTLLQCLAVHVVTGCGGFFCEPQNPIVQAGENIAFGVEEIRTNSATTSLLNITMAVQITYAGPAERFGWILPIPPQPKVSVGSDVLFERLFEATRPTFEFVIDPSQSATCSEDDMFAPCPVADEIAFDGEEADDGASRDEEDATVLEQGVVGPFDFVTLEAAENRPESIFEWLQDNGYDQPREAQPLINYYAGMDMKFVALRLTSDSGTGDIRPVVLNYALEPSLGSDGEDGGSNGSNYTLLERMPVACVPIQLTRIAASPAMPVQIYTFAQTRAFPLNYFHVTLDEQQAGWLNCNNFFGSAGQDCYLNDLRNRLGRTLRDITGHGFVTEYAGTSEIVSGAVAIDISIDNLKSQMTPKGFLETLANANVPDILLVHTLVEDYIPNRFRSSGKTPNQCQNLANVYTPDTPWLMNDCLDYVDFRGQTFDPVGLAEVLEKNVFVPAKEAQEWINQYPYLTRLYGQLDPEEMTKDPFFAFNSELDNVARHHKATAIPVCEMEGSDGQATGLEIFLETLHELESTEIPQTQQQETFFLPASVSCGGWFPTGPPVSSSPALKLEAVGLAGEEPRTLVRLEPTGQFSSSAIAEMIAYLDSRVPNQTIPDFNITDDYSTSSGSSGYGLLMFLPMMVMTTFFTMSLLATL